MNPRWLEQLQSQLRPEALLGGLVAAVALLGLAGCLYVVKPALEEYRALARQRSEEGLEAAMAAAPGNAEAILGTERELAGLRDRLFGGSSTVPLREVESWVIEGLDRISRRHGVELVSVSPGKTQTVLSFSEIPFDVQVRGDYFRLFAWLHDVEEELRPMAVKSFELSGETDHVDLKLRLVSYRPEASRA